MQPCQPLTSDNQFSNPFASELSISCRSFNVTVNYKHTKKSECYIFAQLNDRQFRLDLFIKYIISYRYPIFATVLETEIELRAFELPFVRGLINLSKFHSKILAVIPCILIIQLFKGAMVDFF